MRSLGVLLAEGLDVVVVDLPAGRGPGHAGARGGLEAWDAVRARGARPGRVRPAPRAARRSRPGGDPRERALQAVVRLACRRAGPDPAAAAGRAREPGVRHARAR